MLTLKAASFTLILIITRGGSKQQHITLYPHIDKNDEWKIVPLLDPNANSGSFPVPSVPLFAPLIHPLANASSVMETLTYIKPGMVIRHLHPSTGKHLHSHDVRPPVSEVDFQNEVSGYGFEGFEGDANDNWVVELDESGELPSWLCGFFGLSTNGL